MSIADISPIVPLFHTAAAPHRVAPIRTATVPAVPPVAPAPAARGFALYVGLDEDTAAQSGVSLTELVSALREVVAAHVPEASSYASVAFAPAGAPGESLDLVRLALQEPRAVSERKQARQALALEEERRRSEAKVIVDVSRRRVTVLGTNIQLTYTEFELLETLVENEGRTVRRDEILDVLWDKAAGERPSDRTVDVHVRRLRKKLGDYADIVRTVRGSGYRFDRHADVQVEFGTRG